ncbi:alpha-amylase family glycosyl hydrolase [Sphingomonas prati]|uniref:Alpha-glucosidase n=1 Tax=Sphingomonas prati TaxID=1843237 RepID=A0A7W9BPD6_9SPHN|nr:alpha-amylase family glycosyl hydrolase [Sphingomonas prati]MBB5727678.1 alpha-glucosidase [Sphingomonas prati]GGE79853.1 oligo-1,6-glucosidase [Sphingomonas prati]
MTDWWKSAVLYQVYPRSFQDSDGDGIGDLNGIRARLDYFVALGIDAVWISPIFPSPMADFGYDVADYTGIDPRFGTLADFDALVAAAHARGLKLLLDFVPNHSSDRHPWFVESRSSRTNPKRDWYLWADRAPDGGPPNNWISDFGGPTWTYDDRTGQYYEHAFLAEQPDLNWRNPDLRAAMYAAMRFWFDRGVDGFRIDVLWHMVKAAGFPDNPPNPHYRHGMGEMHRVLQINSTDQPEVHAIAAEMRAVADAYPDRVLIGEIYLPVPDLMAYYGTPERPEVQLPFNFQLIDAEWDAPTLHRIIAEYEAALPPGAWPNWVLGNHDRPRVATKRGQAQARVAAMLLLTLRGTPTLYYGDELGLEDVPIPASQVQDPRELREPNIGLGRDPVRTPMPWDATEGAGFTTATPWLPLNPDHATRNVVTQSEDPTSLLNLHRQLLALRRTQTALETGDLTLLAPDPAILAYHRGPDLLVLLNLTDTPASYPIPQGHWQALASTLPNPASPGTTIELAPNEGLILHRQSSPAQPGA